MPGSTSAAQEYAQALMRFAPGKIDVIEDFFQVLIKAKRHNERFRILLSHPAIPDSEKVNAVMSLASESLPNVVARVIDDLVKRRALELVGPIMIALKELSEERQGVDEATILSSSELGQFEQEQLVNALEVYTKRSIRASFKVDKKLLAGIKIQIKDRCIDNTIKRQLDIISGLLRQAVN